MKKFIAYLLITTLTLTCLFGCGESKPSNPTEAPETATPQPTATPEPTKVPENVARVILLLGQSNAVGATLYEALSRTIDKKEYSRVTKGFANVKMAYFAEAGGANGVDFRTNVTEKTSEYEASKLFKKVRTGMSWTSICFGPEVGMALYLNENYPDENFYIVKVAKGAVSINGSWVKGKYCWDKMEDVWTTAAKAFERDGLTPKIEAICWMQGEQEGSSESDSLKYLEYQADLANRLREYFKDYAPDSGIRFVDAGISTYWKYHENINNAKAAFSEQSSLNYYFSTIDAGYTFNKEPAGNPDPCHFDSASLIDLGKKFAELATKY